MLTMTNIKSLFLDEEKINRPDIMAHACSCSGGCQRKIMKAWEIQSYSAKKYAVLLTEEVFGGELKGKKKDKIL